MEKIKRLIKKILRTICIWWVLVLLMIPAYAALETNYTLSEIVTGYSYVDGSSTAYKYSYRLYKHDFNQLPIEIESRVAAGYVDVVGFFISGLTSNAVYRFSIGLETDAQTETGEIVPDKYINLRLYAADIIDELSYSDPTSVTIPNGTTTITEDDYSLFYDATSKMLHGVMYISDTFAEEHPELMTHSYMLLCLGTTTVKANKITLTSYTGLKADGLYTEILNEISEKLESIAGGGGLTEEQIDQAIQDALAAHDEQLRAEGQSKLDELMAEINTLVAPYASAANDITNALDGFSDVLNSTSTVSVLTLPEARNPLANNALLWPEYHIDMEAAWNQLPAVFRTAVTVTLTFVILYKLFDEVVFILKYIIIGSRRDE